MVSSFDNLDHGLLMTALRKHCQEPWILLYVERWLKAPMQSADGQLQARDKGTPQGGVDHSPNAKGNFCFDRVMPLDRSQVVLDLRLKR